MGGPGRTAAAGTPLDLARRHRRDDLLIALGLAALAWLLAAQALTWRVDRVFYDLGLSLAPRPVADEVVIVAIDDRSVASIGRWPWSRAVHATLLERLAAARPRAIGLDLVLSEPDADPAQDRLLADALRRAAPVVLPVPWRSTSGAGGGLPVPLEPVEPLRSAARLGSAAPTPDEDGILRRAALRAGIGTTDYPHIALALLEAGGEPPHPALAAPAADADTLHSDFWHQHAPFPIRYTGPPGHLKRVSYVDVLAGRVPAGTFAGRYVLVGMTATGLGDAQATPVTGEVGAMPGVEVIGNVLLTLRHGDLIHEVGDRALAAASALAVMLLIAVFGRTTQRLALGLALGSVVAVVAGAVVAVRFGAWFGPAPYAAAALLAYPLWSWRRLEAAVRGLDAEVGRLAGEAFSPEVVEASGDSVAGALTQPGGFGATRPMPAASVLPFAAPQDAIDDRLQTLRSAGELLRLARRFLSTTLEGMPAAVLVGDDDGHVLLANRQAAQLFEVDDAAELRGLDLLRLLQEFETPRPIDWPAAAAALRGGLPRLIVEARLPGHGDHVLTVAAVGVGEDRRLLVTAADIAPVKQAQRQREETLAFVSHDLRSPANSIVLLADMAAADLAQDRTTMPLPQLLGEVRRLARRTLDMSDDFVRAAQAETKPLELAPTTLAALVAEALRDLAPQAQARGVALRVERLETPPLPLRVDAPLVTRAIANLVGNAIKFSPEGGRVDIDALIDGTRVRLRVRDHGPGLSEAQLARLGGEADSGTIVGDARGVGLGLVFVQRVARRHGGRLIASRPTDGGGCFELEFEAAR